MPSIIIFLKDRLSPISLITHFKVWLENQIIYYKTGAFVCSTFWDCFEGYHDSCVTYVIKTLSTIQKIVLFFQKFEYFDYYCFVVVYLQSSRVWKERDRVYYYHCYHSHSQKTWEIRGYDQVRMIIMFSSLRFSQTLMHIEHVHWVVIEDSNQTVPAVERILQRSNIPYVYFYTNTKPGFPSKFFFFLILQQKCFWN